MTWKVFEAWQLNQNYGAAFEKKKRFEPVHLTWFFLIRTLDKSPKLLAS
jgi:hypothetical protein